MVQPSKDSGSPGNLDLARKHEGQVLNGPNDVFMHPSGALDFTAPFYKRPWWTHTEMPQTS